MSNSLSVGAVTATLYRLLSRTNTPLPGDPPTGDPLSDARISTKSPDKARDPQESYSQVNIFLYQVEYNAALRNLPMAGTVKPGESAVPPVALVLNYLLTFYGKSADDVLAHRLLGRALSILNDNANLQAGDIDASMPGSDLARQVERVKLTPLAMSTEEMSRLWTAFQTQYRTSVAIQASVVLINSTQPTKAAPPVLSRSTADRGPQVVPNLTISVPVLATVVIPAGRPSAWLGMGGGPGDVVVLTGSNLGGTVTVIIADLDGNPTVVPTTSSDSNTVTFSLPADTSGLTAGPYTVSLSISSGGRTYTTNGLTFSIAPRIAVSPNPAARDSSGSVALDVTVSPPVLDSQDVSLLVGATEVLPATFTGPSSTLSFSLDNADAGSFPTRLRVDGVDSLAVAYTTPPTVPPAWDPTQVTVIT